MIPHQSVAAATLASARPDWYAGQVMWRLLATADRPLTLHGLSFAGVVNLPRALSSGLIVRSDSVPQGVVAEDVGTQIVFDQEWTSKITQAAQTIDPDYVLLRLTDRTSDGTQICFKSIRYLSFSADRVCVSPTAQITLTGAQGTKTFAASQLEDVFMPMNTDRRDALPIITSTHN
jgi:hypothetical protein